ncbi:MAG TPA: hypothetical protein VFB30_08480 [Spirochaetia bacterium]|nr:hypothetical protein [Spirochaetia bacterium]
MKEGKNPHVPISLPILLVLVILTGCQDIFTYTPLKGLQRDPSTLSAQQRLVYAQDALASGDKNAMLAAYNAIKNDTSPDAVHLTAELGIELSGVPALINDAITNESTLTGSGTTIADYIAAHPGTDPALMIAGGQSIEALAAAGYDVTTNDRLLGAIGLAMAASQSQGYNLGTPPLAPGSLQTAIDLIAPLVASGDTFAKSLNDYLVSYN